MVFNLIIFAASLLALSYSATYLVSSLIRISIKLRFSEFLVGFVLMAMATSLPELAVGIAAALGGDPLLSLGNVVGSNIANLSIVIGIPLLLAGGITLQNNLRRTEILYLNLATVAPLILLLDGNLTRLEGVALLVLFVFYIYDLIFRSRAYHRVIENHRLRRPFTRELSFFALGTAVLLVSAIALVTSSGSLAAAVGIPTILVGIIVIALGTSLPELAFSLAAIRERHPNLLLGNIMGSVVANATLVLGLTALISPIQLEATNILFPSVLVLLLTLVFFSALLRSGKFRVRDALILIFGYLLFVILGVFFGTLA